MALVVRSQQEVLAHCVRFGPAWWERYSAVADYWPSIVETLPKDPDYSGQLRISRQDLFNLADDRTPVGRVRLLLAIYFWGTGPSAFLVGRRVRVFTKTDLHIVADRLVAAAELMHTDSPVAAYESLLARQVNHVKYLGPAFFTKYLYFAAGSPSSVSPQPLILDRKVARALNQHQEGWALHDTGWSSKTYGRYLDLAAALASATPGGTPDGVELGLFKSGTKDTGSRDTGVSIG